MLWPSFSLLWTVYPSVPAPCEEGYENQCAIRLSLALRASGFQLSGYTDPMCKHGDARGAESLGTYLWHRVGRPSITRGSGAFHDSVRGRTGIALFKDIAGFRGGFGDHIDLWDRTRTKSMEYSSAASQVWFWEVK